VASHAPEDTRNPSGSGFIGVGIGVATLAFLALMPFLIPFAIYAFLTIYAITKGTTFAGSTVNVGVIFAGIAIIVATSLVLLFGVVALAGRSLSPKRARRRATEP